jgi:DNA-binding YbaB/EbfC family protein
MDMMNIMGKLKEFQAKVQEAQDNLVNVTETGEAGAGLVKVTVNGQRKVIALEIDPQLYKPEDQDMMKDLVIAAVNIAMDKIEVKIKEELKNSTTGFLPNIPGLFNI